MAKSFDSLLLPALKANMGDWMYYVAVMQLKDIAERVDFAEDVHKSKKLSDYIQRNLLTSRTESIAQYLIQQPQRLFNSMIVGVYGGEPEWLEIDIESQSIVDVPFSQQGLLGFLKLSGQETLFALDGQHRLAGIKKATEQASLFAQIGKEEVSVIFVGHKKTPEGFERTRRLFTTLNRYAKPVTQAEIIALDEDNLAAILARDLVENHKLFNEDRLSFSKSTSLPKTDTNSFTTIITIYKVADLLLPTYLLQNGFPKLKWGQFKKIRPDHKIIANAQRYLYSFWDMLIENFPALIEYLQYDQSIEDRAIKFRHNEGGHILFRPVGLLAYVRSIKRALENSWKLEDILSNLSKIETDIAQVPWKGLLWQPGSERMLTRPENQKLAEKLLLYMIGFDLSKIKPKTTLEKLHKEYASVLNKEIEEVDLPSQVIV